MLCECLRSHGYSVIEACDGDDAVNVFEKHCDKIELVVTDVVMPARNGWGVCSEIRSRRPGMKMLMMSGYKSDNVKDLEVYDDKMAFIAKPIIPRDLIRKIREVLDSDN